MACKLVYTGKKTDKNWCDYKKIVIFQWWCKWIRFELQKRNATSTHWKTHPNRVTQISVYGKKEHNQIDLRSAAAIQTRACCVSCGCVFLSTLARSLHPYICLSSSGSLFLFTCMILHSGKFRVSVCVCACASFCSRFHL